MNNSITVNLANYGNRTEGKAPRVLTGSRMGKNVRVLSQIDKIEPIFLCSLHKNWGDLIVFNRIGEDFGEYFLTFR